METVEIKKEEKKLSEQKFIDLVEDKNFSPHPIIVSGIDNNNFPFKDNLVFSATKTILTAEEFNRCVNLYKRRNDGIGSAMDAINLMQEISQEEDEHKERLKEIAINVTNEMYNVPESIQLGGEIDDCESCSGGFGDKKEDDIDEETKEKLRTEIEKRKILNSIVHGCAIYQWTGAYYLAQDDVNELNPRLMDLYNRYSALINYWNWKIVQKEILDMGASPILQGFNKIDIKGKKIHGKGINFPVLIHELSKGVLDFLISKGIPDLPENELKYLYKEADKYSEEQWHYFLGPTLWKRILESSDVNSFDLPPIISKLSTLDYYELSDVCKDIILDPKNAGKNSIKKLMK